MLFPFCINGDIPSTAVHLSVSFDNVDYKVVTRGKKLHITSAGGSFLIRPQKTLPAAPLSRTSVGGLKC